MWNDLKFIQHLNPPLMCAIQDYGVEIDYLGEGVGNGYVLCGITLRVFCEDSCVDLDKEMKDITGQYILPERFVL